MLKEIPITQGQIVVVDDEDYDRLRKHKWYFKGGRYAYRGQWYQGRTYQIAMHREVINVPEGYYVDHINGNGLDNRKCNLRIVLHQQNMLNMRQHQDSTSDYKGVSWCREKQKWQTHICYKGKRQYLGRYESEIDAAKAYNASAIKLFGEYAHLNQLK